MDSFKGRGNQYIQLVKILYCKLPTNSKQLPSFPLEVGPGFELRSERRECYHSATVAPQCCARQIGILTGRGVEEKQQIHELGYGTFLYNIQTKLVIINIK